MGSDGRERLHEIGALLRDQVDATLSRRVRTIVDRQAKREDPEGFAARESQLRPGDLGPERALDAKELTSLVRGAVAGEAKRTVWSRRGNEATVHFDSMRIAVAEGLILVGLTLETDQTGPQELTSVFAVGSAKRAAGLLAVAEDRPRGHGDLAAMFAEAVIATCWRGLLLVITAVAAAAGRDAEKDPLVPVALSASRDALVVHTVADHRLGRR